MNRSIAKLGLFLLALTACTQVLDFDRDKIPDQGRDSGKPNGMDGGEDSGSSTGGKDSSTPDASMDAGGDAEVPQDAGVDSGPDGSCSVDADCKDSTLSQCVGNKCVACDVADSAGCMNSERCCENGGIPSCIATSLTNCMGCGISCNDGADPVADACIDRQCTCGSAPACDPTSSRPYCDDFDGAGANGSSCVECKGDTDCMGNANGSQCVAGTCVTCDPANESGCSGSTPICNDNKMCEACTVSGMCPGTQTCDPSGYCSCMNNTMCTTPTTPICNNMSKQCQGCTDDASCGVFPGKGQCLTTGECAACDPANGANNAGCTANSSTPICDDISKMCRGCQPTGDCSGATPVCAAAGSPQVGTRAGQCVQCDSDDDCGAATPLCHNNQCVACDTSGVTTADARCDAKVSGTAVCATTGTRKGQCTACDPTDHAGCSGSQLCCENGSGVPGCEGTSAGTQCASCDTACNTTAANSCNNRVCGCGTGAACSGGTSMCTGSPGTCVACTSDAQCSGATPLCNATTGTCTACNASGIGDPNARCGTDTPGSVCATTGSQAGRCAACDPADHDGCTLDQLCCGATPACIAVSTTQCTACTGGGCSATAANNCDDRECGCGTGPVCSGPASMCTGLPGACVACTSDAQCSGATPLCNPSTNTCTACNAAGITDPNARCAAETAGTVCATSGTQVGQCAACDPADHDGCTTAQLCCETGGVASCEATSAGTQCGACDTACSATAANACNARVCGCGTGVVCSGPLPLCTGTPGMCVACITDAQCTTAEAPLCEGGACVACDLATGNDARCTTKAPGTVCASSGTLDGQCVTCDPTDDGGCTGQQCRPDTHTCVACIDNTTTPCAGNLACIANACVACTMDADCTGLPGTQCVASTGQCHACDPTNGGGCVNPTPICSGTFTCGPCTGDPDCAAIGLTTCDTMTGSCS